jgi:phage-related baseplate assembly protein
VHAVDNKKKYFLFINTFFVYNHFYLNIFINLYNKKNNMALPIPNFINRDPATIISEMKADYELRTGRILEPAQVEQLLINAFAYRELLIRNQIQDASLQNLVAFARFPMLDYLGELVGVTRLTSQPSKTTVLLTLVSGHGDVIIPQGLRISSSDGRSIFELTQDYSVLTGFDFVSVLAVSVENGKLYNDYAIGTINLILDPQPFLSTVSNLTISNGGSDEETDEQLRDRIKLAPSAFSNAGSYKAYEFWTKSASPTIIDVAVTNPIPGSVQVFPLVDGLSTTPTEILNAVSSVLNADKIRPLTDTVIVTSPTAINTVITVSLILYLGQIATEIIDRVQKNLESFRDGRRKLLGQDIVVDQIKGLCMIDGVYKCNVTFPTTDLIILETQFANITAINVAVSGTNEG